MNDRKRLLLYLKWEAICMSLGALIAIVFGVVAAFLPDGWQHLPLFGLLFFIPYFFIFKKRRPLQLEIEKQDFTEDVMRKMQEE